MKFTKIAMTNILMSSLIWAVIKSQLQKVNHAAAYVRILHPTHFTKITIGLQLVKYACKIYSLQSRTITNSKGVINNSQAIWAIEFRSKIPQSKQLSCNHKELAAVHWLKEESRCGTNSDAPQNKRE